MTFLVWALLACSAAYWALQLGSRSLATPSQALPVLENSAPAVDLTRLLGAPVVAAPQAAPAQESRYKLLGVVAPKSARAAESGEGVALIAVDGVARTVRVGAPLEEGLQLLAVNARSASIGKDGVSSFQLQLEAPNAPTTGALPPAGPSPVNLGGRAPPMPQMQQQPQQPQEQPQETPLLRQPPSRPQVDNQGNPLD